MIVLPTPIGMGHSEGFSVRSAITLVVVSLIAPVGLWADDLPDVKRLGPYPVGVTTLYLVDVGREDPASKGARVLPTEIWYPATDDAKDLPRNRVTDFLFRGQVKTLNVAIQAAFGVKIDEIDKRFHNVAARDARVRDGKFPLVVFSHGNGGMRFQSTFWCDHIASHGYIVVSCDHTGNAAATAIGGKMVAAGTTKREQAAKDRPADVRFLIDRMIAFHGGEDSRFAGRIDTANIAVAGHSFGGYTAAAVINTDTRVKAIIPMTPVFGERNNYTTPVLLILGAEDKTIGLEGNQRSLRYYEESKGPKYLVNVKDAGHFSFSDMFQYRPEHGDGVGKGERITKPGEPIEYLSMEKTHEITNSYSTAFLGVYLKGLSGYQAFLSSNQYPGEIDYQFAPAATESTADTSD